MASAIALAHDGTGRLLGSIALTDLRCDEMTMEFAAVRAEGAPLTNWTLSLVALADAAFGRGLNALYACTTDYHGRTWNVLRRVADLEVHRRQSDWHRGRFWDSFVFRLGADDFDLRLGRLIERSRRSVIVDERCVAAIRPWGGLAPST